MMQQFWRDDVGRSGFRWLGRFVVLVGAIAILVFGLSGCGTKVVDAIRDDGGTVLKAERRSTRVRETAPPELIQRLNQQLNRYQPQVKILEPRAGETLKSTAVTVKFSVQELPLFKDAKLGLGPHLNLWVDDEFYGEIFDGDEEISLGDLSPGTHTLRAFADRPWHESFKNEGAYAQTTFHIFEPSRRNNPSDRKPLLTYSQPAGTVSGEPVLLDFYLTNAPLHLVARQDETVEDWRVQVTVNGESFVMDSWQPVYLQGLKQGKNWVELELLGDGGEPLDNVYNDTVGMVDIDPMAADGLTQLLSGELPYDDALAIIDPDYKRPVPEPVVEPEPEIIPEPETVPERAVEPEVVPESVTATESAPAVGVDNNDADLATESESADSADIDDEVEKEGASAVIEPALKDEREADEEVVEPAIAAPEPVEPQAAEPEVTEPNMEEPEAAIAAESQNEEFQDEESQDEEFQDMEPVDPVAEDLDSEMPVEAAEESDDALDGEMEMAEPETAPTASYPELTNAPADTGNA
ncbi:MAG: hypothetical protein AAF685_08785 [Cyanobacteria bacterium P01_C01_bin.89]